MNYTAEDIFISYSSKDQATAEKIKALLEAPPRSVSCWMANDVTISGGDDFRSRIVEAIRRCKVFLFILSDSSMNSHWCSLELSFAILENKKIYSIRIDDSPITGIYSFKLGCTQISDGTGNFDAAVESLAINVKNGRDRVLMEEKARIAETKKHRTIGYFITKAVTQALGLAFIISLIVFISKLGKYGGLFELLSASADDVADAGIILASLSIAVGSVIPYIISLALLAMKTGRLRTAASMSSPSALYSMYVIMRRDLFYLIFGKKKAREYLERSAELGYPPAVKRLESLKQKK